MKLFKSRIEKLLSKIKEENLLLLDPEERESGYELQKLLDWQEDYDWVDWQEFKNSWLYCDRCKGYNDDGACICYAR